MKVFITGGTGFVGSALTRRLVKERHKVMILVRPSDAKPPLPKGALYLQGDPNKPGEWQDAVAEHDSVVNLAGATIFRRWTEDAKKIIRESRLQTTKNIVDAIAGSGKKMRLISTSAVGYYGSRGDEVLDESSKPGEGFLATLAQDWEKEALAAEELGSRVVLTRFGVVLGAGGGALEKLVRMFRFWLGSPLGSGEQWFSWIHQQDLVNALAFVLEHEELSGPFNFTAPESVKNKEMTRILGEVMRKPVFMPRVPESVLTLFMGEFGSLLLDSQRVLPKRLLESDFSFRFLKIRDALADLL